MSSPARPANAGILALEVYLPRSTVRQGDLEQAHGVGGKYTNGLGQVSMSFCTDREDVVSMALSAVHQLLIKYGISPQRIGRLEVGTESSVDRSKSIKSHLMRLFGAAGNHDLEGVDSVHGCYGSTAALFNSCNWVESNSWDGRLALVVAADVALYAPGSTACATGGCGAAALLVGPNAPLAMDPVWRATYAADTSDFCKPAGTPHPYPCLDGPATVHHFLHALDYCYAALYRRLQKVHQRVQQMDPSHGMLANFDTSRGILARVDHFVSHAPYHKLVRKAFGRLVLQDCLRSGQSGALAAAGVPPRWLACDPDALAGSGYQDKHLEEGLLAASAQAFHTQGSCGAWVQQCVGNTYTASLYMGLAGLWESQWPCLDGRRILLFAYGSGCMASLFSLVGRNVEGGEFTLERGGRQINVAGLLSSQVPRSVPDFEAACQQVAHSYGRAPYTPLSPPDDVAPGSWVLVSVDESHRRMYERRTGAPGGVTPARSAAGSGSSTSTSTRMEADAAPASAAQQQQAQGQQQDQQQGQQQGQGQQHVLDLSTGPAARGPAPQRQHT